MSTQQLISRFRAARRDPSLAVVEGIHALKHALRFDAKIVEIAARERAFELMAELAPDVADQIAGAKVLSDREFSQLAPIAHPTGIIAIARRQKYQASDILAKRDSAPVIVLDHPQRLDNIGAAIRVAAAAKAGGLIVVGDKDPWNPAAVRAAAGLQYALPVAQTTRLPETDRPIVAFDSEASESFKGRLQKNSVLVFGTERTGISTAMLKRAQLRLRLPMRDGVSSLNLATAVAAVLYRHSS